MNSWVLVSNMFYAHPYLGKIPILAKIFQMGWNQLDSWYILRFVKSDEMWFHQLLRIDQVFDDRILGPYKMQGFLNGTELWELKGPTDMGEGENITNR